MNNFRSFLNDLFVLSEHHKEKRRKRANTWYKSSEEVGNGSEKHTCRTRYQQTPVEVYARFIAVDQVFEMSSAKVCSKTNIIYMQII